MTMKNLPSDVADKLDNIYLDVSNAAAFGGIRALEDAVLKRKLRISRKQIIKYLSTKPVHSIFQIRRKKFKRAPVVAWGIGYLWSIDLADMQSLKMSNNGVRFILVIVDVFTRMLKLVPLKNKNGETVKKAFEQIFESQNPPLYIMSDLGGEFWCYQVQDLFKRLDISHYPNRNSVKSNYSERAIRWVKRKIYLHMFHYNKKRYIDLIEKIANAWNADKRKNPSGFAPNKITLTNQTEVFYKLYDNIYDIMGWSEKITYKIGDVVRVAINLSGNVFSKSYKPQFSQEKYHISRILKGDPVRYGVKTFDTDEDIEGTWYSVELRPVSDAHHSP